MFNFLKRIFSGQKSENQNHKSDPNIIAAKVIKIEKHPNADRLRVISLFDGQKDISPIVCGAFNFSEGDIVALALPGAVISHNVHSEEHESYTLGTAKIRGIESQGMICSGFEIGKSPKPEEKPEILILSKDTQLGKII